MALRPNLIPDPILLTVPDEAGKIPLADFFPAHPGAPVELEIGSGKGTFLLAISQANPHINYVGIEWAKEYAYFAADRLRRHNSSNTRLVHGEASWWIRCHVPDASLQAVHIYFPDPWPKTRHHKRRLIQVPFLKEVHRILKPAGILRLVTDHEDYFAHMTETLAAQHDLVAIPFPPLFPDSGGPHIVGTNFEKKYLAEGRLFNSLAAQKPA